MIKKILIIDDEEIFTRLVKLNLERTGRFEVRVENLGRLAVSAAKDFHPDLVLLDVVMPDISGGSIALQFSEDKDLKDTPIVFLTAVASKKEIGPQNKIISGKPFLPKPATTQEIISYIDKYAK